jgi:hypothetical protein
MRHGKHVVASQGQEFDGFDVSGLVRRGKVRPAGELHAIEPAADHTLCGLNREGLYVFPALDVTLRRVGRCVRTVTGQLGG